jgi:two-component system chemotaxis sensor kinase CheA
VVVVRGRAIRLIRLHQQFRIDHATTDPSAGLLVIVEHEQEQAALLVDEILGQQQVVIKSLEANFARVLGVAGATILGDGSVSLILDVPELMSMAGPSDNGVAPASTVTERVVSVG